MAKGKSSSFTEKSISAVTTIARIALSDSETALSEIIRVCTELTDADYGTIQLLDKDSQTLTILASEGKGNLDEKARGETPIPMGAVGRSARTRKPQLIADKSLDIDYVVFDGDTRSELAVPIIADEQIIGVLNLESTKEGKFTPEDVRIIELLSSIIASALRKSQQPKEADSKKLIQDSKKPLVFVLMPFKDPFDKYYRAIIKPAIEEANMQCLRADEIFGATEIVKDIWKAIRRSEIVIAELTTRNPNVMYELGLSHAIGKPVIMLSQSIDDVPFDLRSIRCLLYDTIEPNWSEQLHKKITQSINAIQSDRDSQPNFLNIK